MGSWWSFLIGTIVAAPVWGLGTWWAARRLWRSARRLAARARGHEHLVELGQLTGGLAHEIKNPLSTINLNLKLLSEDLSPPKDDLHRRWLNRINSVQGEVDRLRAILDDLLRFAGDYELSLSRVDLCGILQELTDFFSPQAEAARVVMRVTLPQNEAICEVDANLFKQAMLNLMINALQAMSDGGELLIRLSRQRRNAVVQVIDTGTGIGPNELGNVFRVYYSTKPQGTGLGLPSTRRIIRKHGGTIRVESELGTGTRFVVTLPLAQ